VGEELTAKNFKLQAPSSREASNSKLQSGRNAAGADVAQVSNLLYSRFPIGRRLERSSAQKKAVNLQAGSPAIQQVGSLRYIALVAVLVLLFLLSLVSTEAATNAVPVRTFGRTNLPPTPLGANAKTNAAARPVRPGATNALSAKMAPGKTNAAPVGAMSRAKSQVVSKFQQFKGSRAFYPALVLAALCLGFGFVFLSKFFKAKSGQAARAAEQAPVSRIAARPRKSGTVSFASCNVLATGGDARQLWQFDARGGGFALRSEQTAPAGETLSRAVVKDWRSLWQRKLNVAWLPPENVFLRVVQLPQSEFSETLAMVELQLEKLSPMPLGQIAWSMHVLPQTKDNMQTIIVMVVGRNVVEEFLGKLEGQGYLADRLELPVLDQLQATPVAGDGAWIYPGVAGGKESALVAWWYGGVLQNLDLVRLPATNGGVGLKEQLMQMAWAGEMEGWLSSPPRWHLVADAKGAAEWEPALREGLEQPVQVLAPVPTSKLAGLTAERAAHADVAANLLPVEFSERYHQQFVDRLWMRGLGAVVGLYLLGVLIYFGRLEVALLSTHSVENQIASLGTSYTNAMQLKMRYQVLKDRQELKYAALDCWKTVAEALPSELTLDGWNLSEGKKLVLNGTAPADAVSQINEFESKMRKATKDGQPVFEPTAGEHFVYHSNPGAMTVSWNFSLELKRSEVQ
jgi:hypothetical protein